MARWDEYEVAETSQGTMNVDCITVRDQLIVDGGIEVVVVDDNYIDLDAIGANPTAKLYSDGSIVGSTDNGSYVKYANGELECLLVYTFSSNTAITTQKETNSFVSGNVSIPLPIETKTDMKISNASWRNYRVNATGSIGTSFSSSLGASSSITTTETTSGDFIIKSRWK